MRDYLNASTVVTTAASRRMAPTKPLSRTTYNEMHSCAPRMVGQLVPYTEHARALLHAGLVVQWHFCPARSLQSYQHFTTCEAQGNSQDTAAAGRYFQSQHSILFTLAAAAMHLKRSHSVFVGVACIVASCLSILLASSASETLGRPAHAPMKSSPLSLAQSHTLSAATHTDNSQHLLSNAW
eukprot:366510-Chlamydomonas_euryale.AAC.30